MPLQFNKTQPHKNGHVSYSSAATTHSNRAKAAFDSHSDSITDTTNENKIVSSRDIALKMFLGKNEFSFESSFDASNAGIISDLEEALTNAQNAVDNYEQVEFAPGEDDPNEENEANLAAALEEAQFQLDYKKALIDSSRAEEGEGVDAVTVDDPSGVYNPDFPLNSITWQYNRNNISTSNRSSGEASIDSSLAGPNLGHPNGVDIVTFSHPTPLANRGGFGNAKDQGTVQDSYLDSIEIARKYESPA